ncbi:MAG: hypothetical protein ACTS9Y_06485 [Methylophilus sp.]|uniref:hypothetical protein n=1 Tax=Methylophilus sp. TaxID=29541 RepID=UPI003FA05DC5
MTELIITPAKGALKAQPVLLLVTLLFVTMANYLGKGFNAVTQTLSFVTLMLATYVIWRAYIASKKQILINKASKQIEVTTYTFFGGRQKRRYPVMYFGAIRSYISLGHRARNVVELITNDGTGSLPLSSFTPKGGKKLWTVQIETENPAAADLVISVANLIPVQNLGFVGHHFEKTPVEKERDHFIRNISK